MLISIDFVFITTLLILSGYGILEAVIGLVVTELCFAKVGLSIRTMLLLSEYLTLHVT
jgi:hypothetical protein